MQNIFRKMAREKDLTRKTKDGGSMPEYYLKLSETALDDLNYD